MGLTKPNQQLLRDLRGRLQPGTVLCRPVPIGKPAQRCRCTHRSEWLVGSMRMLTSCQGMRKR